MPPPDDDLLAREELIRLLSGKPTEPKNGHGLPMPPRPYPFSKEPVVPVADPGMARLVQYFARQFPGVFDSVKSVQEMPTKGVLNMLDDSVDPKDAAKTGLFGSLGLNSREMWVNPNDPDPVDTMAHELSHAQGVYSDDDADRVGRSMTSAIRAGQFARPPASTRPSNPHMELLRRLLMEQRQADYQNRITP